MRSLPCVRFWDPISGNISHSFARVTSDARLSEWEGGPKLQEDSDFTELLESDVPERPVDVHCRIMVRVEVPSDGMTLSLVSPSGSQSSSAETEEQLSKVQCLQTVSPPQKDGESLGPPCTAAVPDVGSCSWLSVG